MSAILRNESALYTLHLSHSKTIPFGKSAIMVYYCKFYIFIARLCKLSHLRRTDDLRGKHVNRCLIFSEREFRLRLFGSRKHDIIFLAKITNVLRSAKGTARIYRNNESKNFARHVIFVRKAIKVLRTAS